MAAPTDTPAHSRPRDAGERLPLATILSYAAPALGPGFMFLLVLIYLMKSSTDVLLVAPATIGAIFGLSRIWDAVFDPMAGYWSDRTRTRWGRRRPWLLASAVPAGVFFVMIWSPPPALGDAALVAWMGVAVFGWFTALTMFNVPHVSLGAELSPNYHERNRVFGLRQLHWGLGAMLAPVGLYLLIESPDPRATAVGLSLSVAVVTALLILVPVIRLRERSEYQRRRVARPAQALRDVSRNPHARLLLAVLAPERLALLAAAALVAGLAGGCSQVLSPSIQADIIDWNELETGERKEGTYFAAWNFVQKSASGFVAMLAGSALSRRASETSAPRA